MTALVDGTTRISYGSLLARADALASRLTGLGLERGDRIVVQLPNCWPFAVLTLGCLRAGIVPVMALPAHRQHELAYLCQHSEARALAVPGVLRGFDHQQMADGLLAASDTLEHILVAGQDVRHQDLTALCASPDAGRRPRGPPTPDPSDVAVFLLSGGTTGLPKLIARTHDDYSYNARASAELCRWTNARSTSSPCPPRTTSRWPAPASSARGCPAAGSSCSPRLTRPRVRRHRGRRRHDHRRRARGGPALAGPRHRPGPRGRRRRAAHPGSPPGRRRPPGRRTRCAVQPVLGATLQQVFGMAEGLLNYTRLDDPDEVICGTQGGR